MSIKKQSDDATCGTPKDELKAPKASRARNVLDHLKTLCLELFVYGEKGDDGKLVFPRAAELIRRYPEVKWVVRDWIRIEGWADQQAIFRSQVQNTIEASILEDAKRQGREIAKGILENASSAVKVIADVWAEEIKRIEKAKQEHREAGRTEDEPLVDFKPNHLLCNRLASAGAKVTQAIQPFLEKGGIGEKSLNNFNLHELVQIVNEAGEIIGPNGKEFEKQFYQQAPKPITDGSKDELAEMEEKSSDRRKN